MNKPIAQRSILRMIVGRFEERPELLDEFQFLEQFASERIVPDERTPEGVRRAVLESLREIVSD